MPQQNQPDIEKNWKIYETLPKELQEVIFSDKTADDIWNICEKNDINNTSGFAKIVGRVLLKLMPLENFQEALENNLGLNKETSKKSSEEAIRLIFNPLRSFLEEKKESQQAAESIEKKAPPKKDTYREIIN